MAADQPGLDGDADDVGVARKPNRGEDADVPQSGNENAFAAHVAAEITEVSWNSVEPLDFSSGRGIADDVGAIISTS